MHRCPDPDNASLSMWEYVTIGVPGFEPGTSATRTQRSTGLSHAPELTGNCYGRGGIRTHADYVHTISNRAP